MRIKTTTVYDKWFKSIKDGNTVKCIKARMRRILQGNFGDYKRIGDGVCELRFHIAGGIRVYYTLDGQEVVLLLAGGDKGSQKDDIINAKRLANKGRK